MKRILISLLGLLMTIPVYAQYYQSRQHIYIDSEITFRPIYNDSIDFIGITNVKDQEYGSSSEIAQNYDLADVDGRIFAFADLLRETFTPAELEAIGDVRIMIGIVYGSSLRPLRVNFGFVGISKVQQTISPAKLATFYRKIKQRIRMKTTFNVGSYYYYWRGDAKINHILEGFIPEDNLDLPK